MTNLRKIQWHLVSAFLLGLLFTANTQAEFASQNSYCYSGPQKPLDKENINDLNGYLAEAEKHARCLSDFISQHGDAIRQHQGIIKSATETLQQKIRRERQNFYSSGDAKRYRDLISKIRTEALNLERIIEQQNRKINQHQEIIDRTSREHKLLFTDI